jgi:hypothetical protein
LDEQAAAPRASTRAAANLTVRDEIMAILLHTTSADVVAIGTAGMVKGGFRQP